MDTMKFSYPEAKRPMAGRAHVGVVASGDMEVLIEGLEIGSATVSVTTSVKGFEATWKAVFDRFFSRFDGAVHIVIQDAGATPGSVTLRLQQAVEVLSQ